MRKTVKKIVNEIEEERKRKRMIERKTEIQKKEKKHLMKGQENTQEIEMEIMIVVESVTGNETESMSDLKPEIRRGGELEVEAVRESIVTVVTGMRKEGTKTLLTYWNERNIASRKKKSEKAVVNAITGVVPTNEKGNIGIKRNTVTSIDSTS